MEVLGTAPRMFSSITDLWPDPVIVHDFQSHEMKDLAMVTQVLVAYRLVCFSAVSIGLPLKIIQKVQLVEEAAAWMLLGKSMSHHATPIFQELH